MKFGERALLGIEATRRRIMKRQADHEARRLDKAMNKLGKYYRKRLIKACTQQQVSYMLRSELAPTGLQRLLSGRKRFQQVRLCEAQYSETELWFRVVTEDGELPFGAGYEDFARPEFSKNLSLSLLRPTRVEYDEKDPAKGLWLVVEVEGSVRGLPSELAFNKAYEMIPASRPPLTFALGATQGGEVRLIDLERIYHMFVAGTTGYGKSVFLNQILITWLLRNGPEDIHLYLFDMKDGQELEIYEGLPHVKRFVKRREEVIDAIRDVLAILSERRTRFSAKGIKKLRDWNATQAEKLPRIVLVFDEMAEILLDPKYKKEVEELLASFVATARSAGGYFIGCTQSPRSDIVTGRLKVNVPGRLCFAVPSFHDSMTVLDGAGAEKLEHIGRALFRDGAKLLEVQCPNLTEEVLKDRLKEVRTDYAAHDDESGITIDDLVIYAIDNLDMKMPFKVLFEEFNPHGLTWDRLNTLLKEAELRKFIFDGRTFVLMPGDNNSPRQLVEIGAKPAKKKRGRIVKQDANQLAAD